jgi:HEPN domain-containing protein/inorganic pyrophosphatase
MQSNFRLDMNWKEFQIQAERDLQSCKILRDNGDFGNAVYLLQQSLEKYLKAYLFKYALFTGDPKCLGHLQLHVLFSKLENDFVERIRNSDDMITKQMFTLSRPILNSAVKLFKKIKEDNLKKIYWKKSLQLELTSEENTKIMSIEKELELVNKIPSISETGQLLSVNTEELMKNYQNPKMKKKIEDGIKNATGHEADKIINLLLQISSDAKNIKNVDDLQKQLPSKLLAVLNDVQETLKSDKPKNESQIRTQRIVQVAWVFQFLEEIFQMFPHAEIGRYPTEIDGKSSRLIYLEKTKELDKLIEKIETVCHKIAQKL